MNEPLGRRTLRALAVINFIVSAVWALGTVAAQYHVYWFYSGALYFTYGCSFVLMLSFGFRTLLKTLVGVMLRSFARYLRTHHGIAALTAEAQQELTPVLPPWNPGITVSLIICSTLGLFPIGAYMASIINAKTVDPDTLLSETARLAHELWTTDAGGAIFILVLLGVTAAVHLVNLGCAAYMYHYHDSLPSPSTETPLL